MFDNFLNGSCRVCPKTDARIIESAREAHPYWKHQQQLVLRDTKEAITIGKTRKGSPLPDGAKPTDWINLGDYTPIWHPIHQAWVHEQASCTIVVYPGADKPDVEAILSAFSEIHDKIIWRGIRDGKITLHIGGPQFSQTLAAASKHEIYLPKLPSQARVAAAAVAPLGISLTDTLLHEVENVLRQKLQETRMHNIRLWSVDRAPDATAGLGAINPQLAEEWGRLKTEVEKKDASRENTWQLSQQISHMVGIESIKAFYTQPILSKTATNTQETGWFELEDFQEFLANEAKIVLNTPKEKTPVFPSIQRILIHYD